MVRKWFPARERIDFRAQKKTHKFGSIYVFYSKIICERKRMIMLERLLDQNINPHNIVTMIYQEIMDERPRSRV